MGAVGLHGQPRARYSSHTDLSSMIAQGVFGSPATQQGALSLESLTDGTLLRRPATPPLNPQAAFSPPTEGTRSRSGPSRAQGLESQEAKLFVVGNGHGSPCLDLSRVPNVLADLSVGADLVVIEGMGRSVHTNLHATFRWVPCAWVTFGVAASWSGGEQQRVAQLAAREKVWLVCVVVVGVHCTGNIFLHTSFLHDVVLCLVAAIQSHPH